MSRETTADIGQRIDKAKRSLEQQRNRLRQLEARKSTQARKERTRKLIVIGAVIAAKAEKEEEFRACLMTWLGQSLTAKRDRSLFDLPEKPDKPASPSNKNNE